MVSINTMPKAIPSGRCDKQLELTYKPAQGMTNNMEVRELVATAENKQEYDSTTPNHTHEPIKHKGH